MPIYTVTTAESVLTAGAQSTLAGEIAQIHSVINHVPSTYVNVVFQELPAENVYTDGVPARPPLITGWVREGHPEADTTRLATSIAAAATRITGVPADQVMVVFQSSPIHYAVEGGRVLPAPGEEAAWIAAGSASIRPACSTSTAGSTAPTRPQTPTSSTRQRCRKIGPAAARTSTTSSCVHGARCWRRTGSSF